MLLFVRKSHVTPYVRLIALAVLMVFGLRAALPAGFMLASQAGKSDAGGLTIVICTQQGPQILGDGAASPGSGSEKPDQDNHPGQDPAAHCPFSVSSIASTPPALHMTAAVVLDWFEKKLIAKYFAYVASAPIGPAVGSRAPPVLS